jgi:hypothetical protein
MRTCWIQIFLFIIAEPRFYLSVVKSLLSLRWFNALANENVMQKAFVFYCIICGAVLRCFCHFISNYHGASGGCNLGF